VTLNGDPVLRYPGNLNLSFAYVEGESLLMVRAAVIALSHRSAVIALQSSRMADWLPVSASPVCWCICVLAQALKNVAVSSGSACTSASLEPSYVLRAIGVSEARARSLAPAPAQYHSVPQGVTLCF
jgi:cysteine desulfurase